MNHGHCYQTGIHCKPEREQFTILSFHSHHTLKDFFVFVLVFNIFTSWAFPIVSLFLMILFYSILSIAEQCMQSFQGTIKIYFSLVCTVSYFSLCSKHDTISIIMYLLPVFPYVVSQHRYVEIFTALYFSHSNTNPCCPRLDAHSQVFTLLELPWK